MSKSLLLGLSLASLAMAQPSVPPALDPGATLAAQPGEAVLLPALTAVVLLPAVPAADAPPPAAAQPGVDASRVPWLQDPAFAREIEPFLGRPVSLASLDRLQLVIRVHLQSLGRPFARVYAPPQDITGGAVRIVVQPAALDGEVRVNGNKWFARERYVGALGLRPGEVLDTAALNADLAWLNRNPFTRVTPVIEAGEQPGTTRVTLRADERLPLSLNAGYANTGTALTDEDRVSVGLTWGNALGRGDLLNVGVNGDPSWAHLRGYSAGYTAFLPWRHILALQAAYSTIDSVMPAPFTQSGKSWQVGASYEIPIAAPRPGWTQNLSFAADFKYSDNTLEFADIPITGNITHIVQIGANYGLNFAALGGQNSVRLDAAASPGGITDHNDDAAFAGSRPGATAGYAYARLGLRHQHPIGGGWGLTLSADSQFATGALLGTEQINGGGSSAVRGYRESSAFGDWGVVGSAELHAPAFAVFKGRDRADLFAFLDGASLGLRVANDSTDLASAGFGLNYQFGRHFSLRGAYGWQLKSIESSRGIYSGHGHLNASLSW